MRLVHELMHLANQLGAEEPVGKLQAVAAERPDNLAVVLNDPADRIGPSACPHPHASCPPLLPDSHAESYHRGSVSISSLYF